MVCSICGSDSHIKTNKRYHPSGGQLKNKTKQSKLKKLLGGKRQVKVKEVDKADILEELFGGAKKGLLADLLKGIDLRIKSY